MESVKTNMAMTDYKAEADKIVEMFQKVETSAYKESKDEEITFNFTGKMSEQTAKACALIYVEGMMEMAYDWDVSEDGKKALDEKYFKDYWQQIKKAIEND